MVEQYGKEEAIHNYIKSMQEDEWVYHDDLASKFGCTKETVLRTTKKLGARLRINLGGRCEIVVVHPNTAKKYAKTKSK